MSFQSWKILLCQTLILKKTGINLHLQFLSGLKIIYLIQAHQVGPEAAVAATAIGEPDLVFDFDDGEVPVGTEVYGTAIVEMEGGVEDSGMLLLTEATNSQLGSFVIDDFNEGANINSIGGRECHRRAAECHSNALRLVKMPSRSS